MEGSYNQGATKQRGFKTDGACNRGGIIMEGSYNQGALKQRGFKADGACN